jgi:predicted adenylyl cyclase CyaB
MASPVDTTQPRANLEIKARCRDLDAARAVARRIATSELGLDHQVDTYFVTRRGRLKLRESSLSGGQLVPYLRPDRAGPKRADYRVVPVEDAEGLKALLTAILGVHRVVRKEREIYLWENVRIHLDRVEGLGCFLELEAVFDGSAAAEALQRPRVDYLMKELGIERDDLLDTSYEALLGDAGS